MSGPMEWAVFSAIGGLLGGALVFAWVARGLLASRDIAIALQFSSRDLAIADLTKDVRHLKNNFEQHKIAAMDDHDAFIRVQAEVDRLGKIVNGGNKH